MTEAPYSRFDSSQVHDLTPGFKGGGGDPPGTDAVSAITRDELDAKLSATESRIEASLARMEANTSHLPSTGQLWLSAASAVVATVGLLLGIVAFGGDRFDGGVTLGLSAIEQKIGVTEIARENAEQTKQIEMLGQQMQQVIMALSPQSGGKSQPDMQFQLPLHRDGSN